MTSSDIVIIGAGPYGMAAGNQLKQIEGLEVRVFGEPMSFWENNMPAGMYLRSNWTATQIADPRHSLTLEAYQKESGTCFAQPVPVDCFIQYGRWYQRKAIPELDTRQAIRIALDPKGFRVTLCDGESITSRRVVVAAGIKHFAWRPPNFSKFPSDLVSHTSEHAGFAKFAGKQMLVIGGGQSALESAALLHENGATVEVFARTRRIHWLQGWASKTLHHRLGRVTNRLLYAPTDVGPAGISQLVARPALLRYLPRALQNRLRKRSVRPAGARWLVDRLREVPIHLGRCAVSVAAVGECVKIRFDDGAERTVDHILLGTGYRIDVAKYDFLAPELLGSLRTLNGYPILRKGLETSIPGLHILGAPAVWSFGPLMQFVSGTHFASQALKHQIARDGFSVRRAKDTAATDYPQKLSAPPGK